MGNFVGKLVLEPNLSLGGKPITQNGRQSWLTGHGFGYQYLHNGQWHIVYVEAGSVTDLASVPRAIWRLFPPDGEYVMAAVIHDYLYRTKGLKGFLTRKECDDVFKQAMTDLCVAEWKIACIYKAVRLGGKGGFGR